MRMSWTFPCDRAPAVYCERSVSPAVPAVPTCVDCDPGAGIPCGGRVKRSWRLPSADTAPVGPSAAGIFAAASWMVLMGLPCKMIATYETEFRAACTDLHQRAGIVMCSVKV